MAKNKYITAKLDWAEKWLLKMEKYLNEHPYDEVTERIVLKEMKGGKVIPMLAASIEDQQKDQRATMKEYLELLAVVKKLRADDESDTEDKGTYGDVKKSFRMRKAEQQKDEGDEQEA